MTGDPQLEASLHEALAGWNERGRLADLVSPLFGWLLEHLHAERVFFFTIAPGGGYRFRACRNADGETVRDPERWISHFAVRQVQETATPAFFPDARRDRRLRTEGDAERGSRSRTILAVPVEQSPIPALIYFDSRFRPIRWDERNAGRVQVVAGMLAAALRMEASEADRRNQARRIASLEETSRRPIAVIAQQHTRPSAKNLRSIEFHGFHTRSPILEEVIEELRRLAPSMLSILIEGESGTGKEILARAVHRESGRKGRFVSLHCGTIPRSLVEIELFGHKQGAFTGAERDRSGLLELARGGTLFLDDVEEMPVEMQLALLRVLESGTFRPLSGDREIEADVRVISARLIGGEERGGDGRLRRDLHYRLAGSTVRVPPLRERREDILHLIGIFLDRHGGDRPRPAITPDAELALTAYDWPGNVRELENFVRRIVALGDENVLLSRVLELTGMPSVPRQAGASTEIRTVLDRAEKEAILGALRRAKGNKSRAARLLGLSRKTLYRRMEKYGIPL